jgi:hypothetical protein
MTVGMAAYAPRFPNQDIVLIEPQPSDYRMFFTNIFSFSSRKAVCEYAYLATRRDLLNRYDELAPLLARHGVRLRKDVLMNKSLDLWSGVGLDMGRRRGVARLPVIDQLDHALTALEHWVDERSAPKRSRKGPAAAKKIQLGRGKVALGRAKRVAETRPRVVATRVSRPKAAKRS